MFVQHFILRSSLRRYIYRPIYAPFNDYFAVANSTPLEMLPLSPS
jgi:hypothetical protein